MEAKKTFGPFNIFAETETVIEFYDLDPMNIVWHGNYLNYFEMSRRALLEKIKYDYDEMKRTGYAFPIVDIQVKYKRALQFKDKIKTKAILTEYENCLKIKYEIINTLTGEIAAKGSSTQMAYDIKASESCFACPEILIEKVEALIKEQDKAI